MKTIILLIALVLSNLGFSCVILPNGNYVPCDAKVLGEIAIEQHRKQGLGRFYNKAEIENVKTNIEYNVKLAESRLNEAEVKYIESIKKYKTTLHNATSKSFKQKVYSDYIAKQKAHSDIAKQKAHSDIVKQKTNSDYIAKQAVYSVLAEQKVYYETVIAKQKAYTEMRTAELEYEKARRECGRIYAIAKGEPTSLPVGKSPSELFKLIFPLKTKTQ